MLTYNKILTKTYLIREYVKKKLSTLKIAKNVNCNDETVRNYLQKFNIKRRTYKEASTGELNPMYGTHRFGKENPNFKTGYCCTINLCNDCGIKLGDPRSIFCYKCANTSDRNPAYIDGRGYDPYSSEFNIELKKKIRERDSFTCQNCEKTETQELKELGRVLSIHHIDYNKMNCGESNLITTCGYCNMSANGNRDY